MSMQYDTTLAIQADIVHRIDALAAQRGHVSVPRIYEAIDQIRHIARRMDFDAVERLADTLQSALSVNGDGPTILSYLDLMRKAAEEATMPAALPAAIIAPANIAAMAHAQPRA